jgi:hypothetical protein
VVDSAPDGAGRSPQDLVEELIRQEAQEDAEEAELNGGILPGTSEDLDEVTPLSLPLPLAPSLRLR